MERQALLEPNKHPIPTWGLSKEISYGKDIDQHDGIVYHCRKIYFHFPTVHSFALPTFEHTHHAHLPITIPSALHLSHAHRLSTSNQHAPERPTRRRRRRWRRRIPTSKTTLTRRRRRVRRRRGGGRTPLFGLGWERWRWKGLCVQSVSDFVIVVGGTYGWRGRTAWIILCGAVGRCSRLRWCISVGLGLLSVGRKRSLRGMGGRLC